MFLDVLIFITCIICDEIYYFWENVTFSMGFSIEVFFFLVSQQLGTNLSCNFKSQLPTRSLLKKAASNPRASNNNKNIYIFIEDWISGLLTLIFHLYAQGRFTGDSFYASILRQVKRSNTTKIFRKLRVRPEGNTISDGIKNRRYASSVQRFYLPNILDLKFLEHSCHTIYISIEVNKT